MQSTHFHLYSCSVPVMGKEEAIICNLHNAGYTTIPQFLCEALQEYPELSVRELQDLYNDKDNSLPEYFDYLQEKQLGFYTDEPGLFPSMELQWHTPERLKHAVIRIDDLHRLDYGRIIDELIATDCINIDLWFTNYSNPDGIESLIKPFNNSSLRSFDIYMPYSSTTTPEKLAQLGQNCHKAADLVVFSAPAKKKVRKDRIYFTPRKLRDKKKAFKNIPRDKFIIYIEFFTESIQHNPYYNRKVCIDEHGLIKNCLTHTKDFGHINSTRLATLPENNDFIELWYACNDKILDIQDSPFRYIWLNTHELQKVDKDLYRMIS
ncbi:MAG: hypothetical protein EOO00_14510 [Chitinophagaceae bacterium]|nr:MAG: hypothetical protein EOO00_14510 [Chitinophagaceae bacterium]